MEPKDSPPPNYNARLQVLQSSEEKTSSEQSTQSASKYFTSSKAPKKKDQQYTPEVHYHSRDGKTIAQTPETLRIDRRDPHILSQKPMRLQYPQGASQSIDLNSETDQSAFLRQSIERTTVEMQKNFTPRKVYNPPQQKQSAAKKTYKFQEKALPLVSLDGNGKFEVNQEIVQMMEQIKGPIGVVAVAGMYRTGKSYLLNRMLLDRQRGFGVGPSVNPCTKGIWIWGTPLKGLTSNGDPVSVLVVDSEGIGGLDEDNNHDMRIFSLALLISSYFIYNSMGQIDENALSSLSLVVNLSQHIAASSRNEDKHTADMQLEQHLPSFIWVVRDFSLQLKDESGNEITDGQYLELALAQKGPPSDPKNLIRQALLKYFKNRECCTMVRPLVDEDKLQRLEEMKMESLRPDFIEQVMSLRRKVLSHVPVKKVNGCAMDGSTWISLLLLYTQAFNEGKVPNIESSWHYICYQKAQQSLGIAAEQFEECLHQLQIPMSHSEIEHTLNEAADASIAAFKNMTKEESRFAESYLVQLETCINERRQELLSQNLQACCDYSQQMLQQLFQELEELQQALMQASNDNTLFAQIDFAIQQLSQFYESNCYDFPEKRMYLVEAKFQFLCEILAIQNRNNVSLQRTLTETEQQMRERTSTMVQTLKEESRAEQLRLESNWKQALLQKSEIEASNQILKEQLQHVKDQKQQDDQENQGQIQKLREALHKMQAEFEKNNDLHEDQLKDVQRAQKSSASEFDKEKALLSQKIKFLETALQDKSQYDYQQSTEWRIQKNSLSVELKQVSQKYEQELKQLGQELEAERELNQDLEAKHSEKSEQFDELLAKHKEVTQTLKQQLADANSVLKDTQLKLNQQINDAGLASQDRLKHKEAEVRQAHKQIELLEVKLKDAVEAELQMSHESKKALAMRDQQIEFLQMQLSESKEQIEEIQRQMTNMVNTLNQQQLISSTAEGESKVEQLSQENEKIKEAHFNQIKDLQSQLDEAQQLQLSQEKDLKLKLQLHAKQLNDAKQLLADSESAQKTLHDKLLKSDLQLKQQLGEHLSGLQEFQKTQFQEQKELQEQHSIELREIQDRCEKQLSQLRSLYDVEKEKNEMRINEEKDRSTRRLAQFQEELEARFKEESRDKEQEIQMLTDQLQTLEQQRSIYAKQVEHELGLKQQAYQVLEIQMQETKERLIQAERERSNTFEKNSQVFDQQRQTMLDKLEKVTRESLEKEKQIAQLQHQLERQSDVLERGKTEMALIQQTFEKERLGLVEKYENAKRKLGEVQDEQMQERMESSRQEALLQQQVEFLNRRIEELQRAAETSQRMFDEKIKQYRQEIFDDAQAQVDRVTSEKELWESKYDQKRRALKDVESSFSKKTMELDRSCNGLEKQLRKVLADQETASEIHAQEVASLKAQLQNMDQSAGQAFYLGSAQAEDMLRLKGQLQECERELQDFQSNYDRDKALWEGKVMFLEQQKENYKRDLTDSQRKFELTLEQLQKRGAILQDKQDQNQTAAMKVLEQKYKTQIREITEANQTLIAEQLAKIKRLEAELAGLQEKLQFESRGKFDETNQLERKLLEALEHERRISIELTEVKAERQKRVQEYQKQLNTEKDNFKIKLAEADRKAKDAEAKRGQLFFQYEKERANWLVDEESYKRRVQELEEILQSLERTKESLRKENDKLLKSNGRESSCGISGGQQPPPRFVLNTSLQSKYQKLAETPYSSGSNNVQGQGTTSSSIVNAAINKFKDLKQSNTGSLLGLKMSPSELEIQPQNPIPKMSKPPIKQLATVNNRYRSTTPTQLTESQQHMYSIQSDFQ